MPSRRAKSALANVASVSIVFLKRLTMKGFKSFADTTVLEFEPGVTAVVGPNGSGKSNVVDAVTWVLGAQSTRALRSSKMDDVIFMGTANRAGARTRRSGPHARQLLGSPRRSTAPR